jgi:CRISPR/Cas system-associated exonuclease Cas4 (RecB family)
MTSLPTGDNRVSDSFLLSQSSLQDYLECPRRFQLRYLQNLQWPAVEVEPLLERERHMQLGDRFHQMAHQYLNGVPGEVIAASIDDSQLAQWWEYFADTGLQGIPERRYSEVSLVTSVNGFRLVAKYDLVAIADDGSIVIVDWKTNTNRPKRNTLERRMQTKVYPYVMARSGADLNNGRAVDTAKIEMIYWFANTGQGIERFAYSDALHATIGSELRALIREIEESQNFTLTEDHGKCLFCTYRSLCRRGEKAGDLMALLNSEEDPPGSGDGFDLDDFDFDQIAEVEF